MVFDSESSIQSNFGLHNFPLDYIINIFNIVYSIIYTTKTRWMGPCLQRTVGFAGRGKASMSNRSAGGRKQIKKCGQALFIDGDALIIFNSVCNIQNEYHFSWAALFAYLRQLLCTLSFVIEFHAAGIACGHHKKLFSKLLTGSASLSGEMYGLMPGHSFFQNNNGEHIKMKFETGNLRSCTDVDDHENSEFGMIAGTPYRQRSRSLTFGDKNSFRTSPHDPHLLRAGTAIGGVQQMKAYSLSTALFVFSSPHMRPGGAERRGCA